MRLSNLARAGLLAHVHQLVARGEYADAGPPVHGYVLFAHGGEHAYR